MMHGHGITLLITDLVGLHLKIIQHLTTMFHFAFPIPTADFMGGNATSSLDIIVQVH